ncbi:hypothetical protein N8955_00025 [bacterium]|jgi:hypothetical protein|nr:hypothetical protein [Hellea sp.]MDA7807101.1 hypothetical protein [bacterium]MDA9047734.1 hypothetical protein [Hellea sp.]MDA9225380.1 hypothetical protein [bacterium]
MANKIPFWMLPASWGLTGKSKLRAKAEYELTGIELKKELARIDIDNDIDAQVSDMDIDVEAGTITKAQRDKAVAEIKDEPWVEVKHMEVNPEDVKAGYMELDWNDQFVAMLHAQGYTGDSDESVVNKWFNDICRTVLMQENADMDFGLQSTNPDVINIRNKTDGIDD